MLGRRKMADEENVAGPRKSLRILRPPDEKPLLWKLPGRFDQQGTQSRLAVLSISSQVGEVRSIILQWGHSSVVFRIDTAIQGQGMTGAQVGFQSIQGRPSGEAQHQVKIGQPARSQIAELLTVAQPLESDWRIEVIKNFLLRRRTH